MIIGKKGRIGESKLVMNIILLEVTHPTTNCPPPTVDGQWAPLRCLWTGDVAVYLWSCVSGYVCARYETVGRRMKIVVHWESLNCARRGRELSTDAKTNSAGSK